MHIYFFSLNVHLHMKLENNEICPSLHTVAKIPKVGEIAVFAKMN